MKLPLLLLPGLGANEKLFEEQRKFFGHHVFFPKWIEPQASEGLEQYVDRYVETIEALGSKVGVQKENERTLALGGFSFGGMVSLELAYRLNQRGKVRAQKVLLISSGRTQKILKPSFVLQTKMARSLPDKALKQLLQNPVLSYFLGSEKLSSEHQKLMEWMSQEIDISFFKWSLGACASWNPGEKFLSPNLNFEIHEIQGEKDPFIPFSSEANVTTIPSSYHLIQYNQAREVNQWIQNHIHLG